MTAGIVPVPLNTLHGADVNYTILRYSRAKVLFVSKALLGLVEPILAKNSFLKCVFVVGDKETKHLDFEQEIAKSKPTDVVSVIADEAAFWLYSSGSAGQPKGVRHIHRSLQFTADTYGGKVLGIKESDVVCSAAKFLFPYGLGNALTFPMSVGATTVLLSGRPTPDDVHHILNAHKPSIFCGVPTLYGALVDRSACLIDFPTI